MSTVEAINPFSMSDSVPNQVGILNAISVRLSLGSGSEEQLALMLSDIFDPESSDMAEPPDKQASSLSKSLIAGIHLVEGYVSLKGDSLNSRHNYGKQAIYRAGYNAVTMYIKDKDTEVTFSGLLDAIIETYEAREASINSNRSRALNMANQKRSHIARSKIQLKEGVLRATGAVNDPVLAGLKAGQFLILFPGVGSVKAAKIIKELGIKASDSIDSLDPTKIPELIGLIPEFKQRRIPTSKITVHHEERLKRANEVRSYRADVKRKLSDGSTDLASVITDPRLAKMKLADLIIHIAIGKTRFGVTRQKKIFEKEGFSSSLTCGKMTERQVGVTLKRVNNYVRRYETNERYRQAHSAKLEKKVSPASSSK